MNASRAAAWIFVAAVLGAWLASAAGVSRSTRTVQVADLPPAAHPVDRLAADVQAQAGRLRQRLDAAPAPQTPVRNPFTFSARAESRPRLAQAVRPAALVPPPPPAEPILVLVGIAEKKVGDATVRTAMLSNEAADLIMATTGQRIMGVYDVVAIGLDAVELRDVVSGATRRLALR